ncbi:MAG: elongation factor 4 [Candidatus Magasanikbacteria bacterium CG10_big_fil_rev_8_21_14_0_10_40_10]|uniref:Elongation factor 4 n=1 Tax=Candidatus Magasanikbacteria bacterium CG10_big_fil_rev_8_21_14_0_10_40_10 TaxID=1974648 RepID=A0A2M6W518_9BACT|nr:MAG: elongation factor 4 [Candidatus Magasanikbacteria bacterium CG10_big_fil_rev_8_21_14_0_10_40_10]
MSIRNFCIIAHIDHGKSTLADRFLEMTNTVDKRKMHSQVLDSMELEQERGITIKLTPVRMKYELNQEKYTLNLIDTPGHVDFNYEVSRSLAAVEGAILLVDATQGVQAQTIGNLYLAIEQNLKIIPVINKIDMPAADIIKTKAEIIHLLGCQENDILLASAKTGQGVEQILQEIIKTVPPPPDNSRHSARALIFDSHYDDYRGVVASVRVIDGQFKKGEKIFFMGTQTPAEILELGYYSPQLVADQYLENGAIGYMVTGLKNLKLCRVGDTISLDEKEAMPLPGYREVKPMVYAGIFPKEGDDYTALREAMDKLKLSDSSLSYEPENSPALGFGFRCGFLGLLHLDIFQERLKREHDLDILITVPSVAYHLTANNGATTVIHSPQELPDPSKIKQIMEPYMNLDIITPQNYIGNIMSLVTDRKGRYLNTEYLSAGADQRAILHYQIPLASLITDFYDKLKTVSSGFASMNYELKEYENTDVVKLDFIVADEPVEALSTLVWRDNAFKVGKKIVEPLKNTLPRQQFVLKIQAAIGGKIIAADRLSALRKDVTAKLYGGDVTRKRKLLEKQKKGKKKMMALGKGKVDIPNETYMAVLKR